DEEAEMQILERRISWQKDDPTGDLAPAVDHATFVSMQKVAENGVFVDREVVRYMAQIVRALREHPDVTVGPSPRGSLALLRVSRAYALIQGRDFVTPDDVKVFTVDALAHRTILDLEATLAGKRSAQIVQEVVQAITMPQRFSTAGKAKA